VVLTHRPEFVTLAIVVLFEQGSVLDPATNRTTKLRQLFVSQFFRDDAIFSESA
jgi:hypothetical protein